MSCLLCFNTVDSQNSSEFDEVLLEIFEVLFIKQAPMLTGSRICKECLNNVKKAFAFKSKCLETEDELVPYFSSRKNNQKIDLLSLIIKKENKNNDLDTEELQVCRLCKHFMSGNKFVSLIRMLNETDRISFFHTYIPEIDLEVTENSLICGPCQTSFQIFYDFISTTRVQYMDQLTVDNENLGNRTEEVFFLKNEELDIKSEENEDIGSSKIFKCPDCPFQSKDKTSVRRHRIKHSEKYYDCSKCIYKTNRRQSLKLHIRAHHDVHDKIYKCHECSYQTYSQTYLTKHIRKHIKEEVAGSKDNGIRFNCPLCKYVTTQKRRLKMHMGVHLTSNLTEKFTCATCFFTTRHKPSLRTHMLSHRDYDEVKTYDCPECTYKSKLKSGLAKHMRSHQTGNFYKCDMCLFECKSRTGLSLHKKVQHSSLNDSSKSYNCDKCSYKSITRSKLTRHMMVHDDNAVKQFQCQECPFQTNFKENLRKHILVHKKKHELELHKCPDCDFQTKHKQYLKTHKLLHGPLDDVKSKVYKCTQCSYETKWSGNLRQHTERNHTKLSKQFKCGICSFETEFKTYLSNHILFTHKLSGIEYKCEKCPYKVSRPHSLKRHLRVMHNIIVKTVKAD